ncbi:hypothetical protein AGMMS49992_05270 [Clostridia bacterium]|nr:hypothetical protein AGMMS49992_05270 [Clostridia bacterium]
MSMPQIRLSNISRDQCVNNLIGSIALEEAALAHILNADGEKIQLAASMADPESPNYRPETDFNDLLSVNDSVISLMESTRDLEYLLALKLMDAKRLIALEPMPTPKPPPPTFYAMFTFPVVAEDDPTKPLPKTAFVLQGIDPTNSTVTLKSVANADGILSFRLPNGNYLFTQASSISGYAKNTTNYIVSVSEEAGTITVSDEATGTILSVQGVNDPPCYAASRAAGGKPRIDVPTNCFCVKDPIGTASGDIPRDEEPEAYQKEEYCLQLIAEVINSGQPLMSIPFKLQSLGSTPEYCKIKTTDADGTLNFGYLQPGSYCLTFQNTTDTNYPFLRAAHKITVCANGVTTPDSTIPYGAILVDGSLNMIVHYSRKPTSSGAGTDDVGTCTLVPGDPGYEGGGSGTPICDQIASAALKSKRTATRIKKFRADYNLS